MDGKEYWRKSLVLRPAEVTETFRIEQDGISGMSRWKGATKRHPTTRWRSKCVTHNDVVSLENILKLPFVCQNMKPQERFDYRENFYGFSSVLSSKIYRLRCKPTLVKNVLDFQCQVYSNFEQCDSYHVEISDRWNEMFRASRAKKKLTDIISKDNDRQFHNYWTNYLFQRLQVCT